MPTVTKIEATVNPITHFPQMQMKKRRVAGYARVIKAYEDRNPDTSKLLFHSDQGYNYTSKTFRNCLSAFGIQQSLSRKGVPYDNSVCESFFKSLKQEELYRTNYRSEKHLRNALSEYVVFYNDKRPHTYLHYRTPNKAEADYYHYSSQKEKAPIEQ